MHAVGEPGVTGRTCFVLRLRPDRVDDYLTAHEHVWPEMREALTDAGWANYTLFLDRSSAAVIGYVEAEDFAAAQAAIQATGVNARWQSTMSEYFEPSSSPEGAFATLPEYFHLD